MDLQINKTSKKEYKNAQNLNLVNMLLSLDSNKSSDINKISDLMNTFSMTKELKLSDKFIDSLKKSNECLLYSPRIKNSLIQLESNNPESFLLLPIFGERHLFSSLIRKTDEGFSVTLINKGGRFFHGIHEEYVFGKEKIFDLNDVLNNYTASNPTHIEDIYQNFKEKSTNKYVLKTSSRSQKTGNCFVKNMEAGIKFAYSTTKLSQSDLRNLRNEESSNMHFDKNPFKPKWNSISTAQVHHKFVENFARKNPAILFELEDKLDIYDANKKFGELIEAGKSPTESFSASFNSKITISGKRMILPVDYLLSKITLDTILKYKVEIGTVIDKSNLPEHSTAYKNLLLNMKNYYKARKNIDFRNYMKNNQDPLKSFIHIWGSNSKTEDKYDPQVLLDNLKHFDKKTLDEYRPQVLEVISNVHSMLPSNKQNIDLDKFNTALYSFAQKKENHFIENCKNSSIALNDISNYLPIQGEDMSKKWKTIFKEYTIV